MIRIEQVHKTLSGRRILDGLDLEVGAGETLVILGRSGIGKSVTLRHIVGLMKPDSGRVTVLDRDLAGLDPGALLQHRRKIGYLFQDGALLNWMNLAENVALPLTEHESLSRREVSERVEECLAMVELENHMEKLPSEISGGMRKRAGLARALVNRPQIVLYDEPTSGLDPISSSLINRLVNDLRARLGVAQVVVTHDMGSAFEIGDRCALLHNGRIRAVGTPEEIQSSPDPAVQQFIHGHINGPLSHDVRYHSSEARETESEKGDQP
ncbi:MAG: ABC transporter ATP-binding protein [Planctomycetota bacterium]|jgi:phospholipid/cholesterol/gamma-HCH transport system ATP-binding protein